jgi:cytohesin
VRTLLEAGVDVNKANNVGVSPLYIAAQNGHEAILSALIEAGADVNKASNDGETPLIVARVRDHKAIFYILMDAGAVVPQKYVKPFEAFCAGMINNGKK